MLIVTSPTGAPDEVVVPLDVAHWARQGTVRLEAEVVDDRIVDARVIPGFMHRGAEKLFEARDLRQGLALANRHDWLVPAGGEIALARAAEELMGLEVPPRARVLRELLLQVGRAAALLAFLGSGARDLALADGEGLLAARERLLGLIDDISGARMHLTYAVIGGVRDEPPEGWTARVAATCAAIERAPAPHQALAIGVIPHEVALGHGASGPIGRASGIGTRTGDPAPTGDVHARTLCLSLDLDGALVRARELCAEFDACAPGPVNVPLPKVVRAPQGTAMAWVDTAMGSSAVMLESRGDRAPHRVALRTPSFAHASLLPVALRGEPLGHLPAILSSMPMVIGDIDK